MNLNQLLGRNKNMSRPLDSVFQKKKFMSVPSSGKRFKEGVKDFGMAVRRQPTAVLMRLMKQRKDVLYGHKIVSGTVPIGPAAGFEGAVEAGSLFSKGIGGILNYARKALSPAAFKARAFTVPFIAEGARLVNAGVTGKPFNPIPSKREAFLELGYIAGGLPALGFGLAASGAFESKKAISAGVDFFNNKKGMMSVPDLNKYVPSINPTFGTIPEFELPQLPPQNITIQTPDMSGSLGGGISISGGGGPDIGSMILPLLLLLGGAGGAGYLLGKKKKRKRKYKKRRKHG